MVEKRTTFGNRSPGSARRPGSVQLRRERAKAGIVPKPNQIAETHPDIVREFAKPKPPLPTTKKR